MLSGLWVFRERMEFWRKAMASWQLVVKVSSFCQEEETRNTHC